jgi:hemolysin III
MLDYLAIYPLIAGTFTPLCLVFLHDTVIGWSFFGVAWFFAILGMYLTATLGPGRIPKWFSMTMYITMGWIGAFLMFWLMSYIEMAGLALFIVGGLWYTIGGYIYTTERPNPYPGVFGFHEIWHVMVILGVGFHFAVMFFYVLPWEG